MKKNKILISGLMTLLLATSCTRIDDKNYDSYTLYYKEYSSVSGHRFQYLKKDASKDLGEKVYSFYKTIIESNSKYTNLRGAQGFEDHDYYIFTFNKDNSLDRLGISTKEENQIYIYYRKPSSESYIFRMYRSLNEEELKKVNEFKSTFKDMLADASWIYNADI